MANAEQQTTAVVVPVVNTETLKTEGSQALASAQTIIIDSDEMYELASGELTTVKSTLKKLEDMRLAVSGPLHKAMTANNENFSAIKAPWEAAEKSIKTAMVSYVEEKERAAAEERRIAEEAAAKLRREAEAAAEEARRVAEQALERAASAATAEEQDVAMDAAIEAEEQAESLATEAALAAPVYTSAAKVRPIGTGTSVRGTWKASVTNKLELLKHIVAKAEENPDLLLLVTIDAAALNRRAKALEKNLNLPGVQAVFERSIAARAA